MAKATYRPNTNDFLVTLDNGSAQVVQSHDEAVTLMNQGQQTAEQASRNETLPAQQVDIGFGKVNVPGSTIVVPDLPSSIIQNYRAGIERGSISYSQAIQEINQLITSGQYQYSSGQQAQVQSVLDQPVTVTTSSGNFSIIPSTTGSKVIDANILSGNISGINATRVSGTGETTTDTTGGEQSLEDMVFDMLESVVASGNTINPNITEEDLAALDIENFIGEAEASVADEFKQKFANVKQDLVTFFERTDVDLAERVASIGREKDETQLAADESFSGRGTAVSSRRLDFDSKLVEQAGRATDQSRKLALRSAEDVGRTAERQVGTEALRGTGLPSIGGEQAFELSGTPIVGSLQREKQFTTESLARQLQLDESRRRAFTQSNLGFA